MRRTSHSKKSHRKRLHKAGHRQRGRERERCPAKSENDFHADGRKFRAPQHRLQREPFAHETVERRQRRYRERASEKASGRPWHSADQSAQLVQIASSSAVVQRSSAEKQQRLIHRMVDHMIKGRDESDPRQRGLFIGCENQSRAEACRHNSNVFDGTVGEHGLEVILDGRVKDSHQRRNRSDDEHNDTCTNHVDRHEIKIHANDSVDSQI